MIILILLAEFQRLPLPPSLDDKRPLCAAFVGVDSCENTFKNTKADDSTGGRIPDEGIPALAD